MDYYLKKNEFHAVFIPISVYVHYLTGKVVLRLQIHVTDRAQLLFEIHYNIFYMNILYVIRTNFYENFPTLYTHLKLYRK